MRRIVQSIRRRLSRARRRPLILMYHRVAEPAVDPWGLAVHPDRFEAHLRILRSQRTPLPMSAFVRHLSDGTLPDDAVAVTFDDGYADNAAEARPRLETFAVPATIFLAAGAVGQRREFWWDEVARGILARRDGLDCDVTVSGRTCRIALPEVDDVSDERSWRAWQEPRTPREHAFIEIWTRMREANASERDGAMSRFREATRTPPSAPADLPMTASDVENLARDGLFEIGGHTLTHPVLPALDARERRREIAEGKRLCEALTSRPVKGFAYPHGAMDEDSRAAVRDSGFEWAVTTASGCVMRGNDPYALPRVFVQDWDAETFERALS